MTAPWTFASEPPVLGAAGDVTSLVEGSSFCVSAASGDIVAGSPHGLFFRDSRLISRWELRLNGSRPEALAHVEPDPFAGVTVARDRPRPGHADSTLMLFRRRWIGRGMREDIELRNVGKEPAYCRVELAVESDFADLFEVKEQRVSGGGQTTAEVRGDSIVFTHVRGESSRRLTVAFGDGARVTDKGVTWEAIVPADGTWSASIGASVAIDDHEIEPRFKPGVSTAQAAPEERLNRWRAAVPDVDSDHPLLASVIARGAEDLGALRIFDPEHPERAVVAAGAPWFMTLFGRDSLLTSWMSMVVDPDLALGVLQTLARFQGTKVDLRTEEEPGRILHEMRFGEASSLSLGGGTIYYGTADATPLFVIVLGELRRWGLAPEIVDALAPNAEAAVKWLVEYGDADGDGYVEYQRKTDHGLANQGWKDSWDGVQFADGTIARAPIALAEVQGYAYAAYLAWAYFLAELGRGDESGEWRERAAELKRRFNEDFWLEDKQCFAIALDGDKRPVDAVASNQGHCLWTGIVEPERAAAVVRTLMSPEMFSGWGVRTMATSSAGYNPIGYHTGSVWPHDNAVIVAGLVRYGFVEEAHVIMNGMFDAAALYNRRLPELFAGLARDEFPGVVPYPTSCSPQAWASATPLAFLRAILRLDPWVPHAQIWMAPQLLPGMSELKVHNINLGGGRVTVLVTEKGTEVEGLPDGIELVTEPRDPMTAQTPSAP
ncbi:MAG TPA: glycogen debranching N-terminal domain-containing protein [Acidimicrobiales bacterium]|nr:glycogen debranching N-terminal domain-containing protein [Acidimicrobiales bacterium]